MSPFLGLARTGCFRLLHPLFRVYTEDQPHRHLVAIRQLHNYVGDLPRIPVRTPFEASQHLEYRTDRGLVVPQQVGRILPRAPCPVGPNTSRLQCADLDPERRDFHRQRVAETADSPLGRVIRRIAGNRVAATDRRHLKDVTALLLTHHWDSSACCVHHTVKACVHDSSEVLRTHLLERRKLPKSGIVDQNVQPPEGVHRQLHGSLCCCLIAHFQPDGLHPRAVLRHQRRLFLRATRSGYHAVARSQRRLSDVPPQSVSASRNQPDLPHCKYPPVTFASTSVRTHSFIRCTDSLLGYARPKHLEAAIPVLIRFGWVRHRKVYRRLYQGCQRLRDEFHRDIIPKDPPINRVTNHGLELHERRAAGVPGL